MELTAAGLLYNAIGKKVRKGFNIEKLNSILFVMNYDKDELGLIAGYSIKGIEHEKRNPKTIKLSEHGNEIEEYLVGKLKSQLDPLKFTLIMFAIDYRMRITDCNVLYISKDGEELKYTETLNY